MPDDQWVAENYSRIHRAAWLMTGDRWEAEDLAQEAFVIAIDRWDRFDGRSSRATWLFGILLRLSRRRARTLARLRRRIQEYVSRNPPEQTRDPKAEFAYQQWRESLWASVARLPEPQRDAVLLRFAEGMTYEQIAETVGCAVGTAKTRVHHGLKRLRLGAVEGRQSARPLERSPQPVLFGSSCSRLAASMSGSPEPFRLPSQRPLPRPSRLWHRLSRANRPR